MNNFIIQRESDDKVSQWRLDRRQTVLFVSLLSIILLSFIFLSADILSHYFYEKRLDNYKENYNQISNNLQQLQLKLKQLDNKLDKIEEKDRAVRVYAGMPNIDKDIRKLGTGGHILKSNILSDNLAPAINKELVALELDIEKISRHVNLELNSYSDIYEKVKEDVERISKIPSIRPVKGGFLNSSYGYRKDPIDNVMRFHQGQDITVKSGTPIYAPADGIVKRAYYAGGFGNHIKLDHGNGYSTLFAHLSKIKVKHGQKVKRGDVIGHTGNTGRSTAPHLHYEIHYYGESKNPLDYFFHNMQ
ncbi:MAG: peptidase M23 [Candidatus Marinimicrobia bacterium]|nr:peptidase M23 [Candidatus Neomarinimicrobiota bacterium]